MTKIKSFICKYEVYIWAAAFILALMLGYLFTRPIFRITKISGPSMMPTFQNGDVAVVTIVRNDTELHAGDIVLAIGKDKSRLIIKRLAGVPGETIENLDVGIPRTQLGEDEYFLLGDNYEVSYDSRYVGTFSREEIVYKFTGISCSLPVFLLTCAAPIVLIIAILVFAFVPEQPYTFKVVTDPAGDARCVSGGENANKVRPASAGKFNKFFRKKGKIT